MIKQFSDIKIPDVLYKYRSWNNKYHRRLLTHYEIYLANIYSFNDPFDSTIPVRWELMSKEDCYQRNLDLVNIWHKDKLKNQRIAFAKEITDNKELWHPENMKLEGTHTYDKWNEILGLISLSEKYDDILMWSHYGDFHKGIAVGLSTEHLMNDYEFDYIDKVVYSVDYPILKGTDDSTQHFYQRFFSKFIQWEYEQEWRITKNHVSKKQRKVKLNGETIVEIVLGCQMPEKDKSEIRNLIKKKLPHVVIKQAERDADRFKLNIVKL